MGRKNKSSSSQRPNAPDIQILQQPPHNPYYPDPSATALLSSPPPPPPYSQISKPINSVSHSHYPNAVPMGQLNTNSNINYPRFDGNHSSHVPITIQSYDRRSERYNRRVRSFNNQTLLIAVVAIALSMCAYSTYPKRNCFINFTIAKPSPDVTITLNEVRDGHKFVAFMSVIIAALCVLKSCCGYNAKSYPCYLFIMGLCSLAAAVFTGYLAYLAFYSPCALTGRTIGTNLGKTVFGGFMDRLPAPESGAFAEQNVLELANEDRGGVMIFLFDLINFISYLSVFVSALTIC